MKIRIAFTLDIDKEAWMDRWGTEPKYVAADVRHYYENLCIEKSLEDGVSSLTKSSHDQEK